MTENKSTAIMTDDGKFFDLRTEVGRRAHALYLRDQAQSDPNRDVIARRRADESAIADNSSGTFSPQQIKDRNRASVMGGTAGDQDENMRAVEKGVVVKESKPKLKP